jgi:hypothetical protein
MKLRVLLQALGLLLLFGPRAYSQFPVNCIDYATVSVVGGATQIVTCEGDGVDEVYRFRTSTLAMPFGYLVTDENNIILKVSIGSSFGFEGLGGGNLRVWAFSFLGEVLAQPGLDATTAPLGSVCSALSTNFIPVINFVPDAGAVATASGATTAFVCVGDGQADVIEFINTSAAGQNYAYLITDEGNVIIEVVTGDSFDFDGLGDGVYRVWGLAYASGLLAQPGDAVGDAALAEDCFGISENFIEVTAGQADGGRVQLANGETSAVVCVEDGIPDVLTFEAETSVMAAYAFLITDEDNIIIEVVTGNSFDFERPGSGTWRVWGLSYTGSLLAQPGQDAAAVALSSDCFDLSENFIEIIRQRADSGMVSLEDGATEALACVGDGQPAAFSFVNTSAGADNYVYLITDEDNVILAISLDGSYDFDTTATGTARVWGLAYAGNLLATVGDDAAATALADGCFRLSENFITIIKETALGGDITFADGSTLQYLCTESVTSVFSFESTGAVGDGFTFVVTDEQAIILGIPDGDSFDFAGAPESIYYIWGLAYTGDLTAEVGDTASIATLSTGCFNLSSNFIAIILQDPFGGQVQTPAGETTVYTCPGDGNADVVTFESLGASITPFTFVITDEDNVIVAVPDEDEFDFDGLPEGNYRVWGLAYTGNIIAAIGDTASVVAITDDCFSLSVNFITVVAENPRGGTVATDAGATTVYTCPGDGNPDVLVFENEDASSGLYAYVITDEDNNIIALASGDSFDFEDAPVDVLRVWGLAYTGNITAQVGDNAGLVDLSDDCYELSANFITVIRETPVGGEVSTVDGLLEVTICPGDGNPDIVEFANVGGTSQYVYVFTNEENLIISVLTGNAADFDLAGVGVGRVWGLAYTGNLIAQPGDDAGAVALSDDCFDLSENFVTIIREIPIGGTVATADGQTEVQICPGDGIADVISFVSANTVGTFVFVLTDNENNILDVLSGDSYDFDNSPEGICRVWGLAYSGNLIAQVGDNAGEVPLSDDCFDLSDNFVTIIKQAPVGGMVSTATGATQVILCPDGSQPDIINFANSGAVGAYAYVLTDEDNTILALLAGNSFDFGGSPEGAYRVWGLAYTGNITAEVGDNAALVALSDDCFDLSENFVNVVVQTPNAGILSSGAGPVNLEICAGDGNPDIVEFVVDGASISNYLFLITDENDFLIGALDMAFFDFNNIVPGIYRVYGLAFTGSPIVIPGDNIFDVNLSSDCFDLTDNFLEINAIGVDGATIFTSAGVGVNLLNLCVGDGEPNVIQFFTTTSAGDADYVFAVTNENDIVIGFIPGDEFDFELAGPGVAKIWGISYTGDLLLNLGDLITGVPISSECYDFAANVITVVRGLPNGGAIAGPGGATDIEICPGPDSGVLPLSSTGNAIVPYVYLLTDVDNVIIAIYDADEIDFNDLPIGDYRVWGLSYTGVLSGDLIGQDAASITLATSCFDLSDNFIAVYRGPAVDGGIVSTFSGQDTIYSCPDGVADLVVMQTTSSDVSYTYVITNADNRVIVPNTVGDLIDFEGAAPGIYRVWGLSYNGDILLNFNQDVTEAQASSDCFQFSENFITVIREAPVGGTVLTTDGADVVTAVVGDGEPDEFSFIKLGASPNTPYAFVLTDEDNLILELLPGDSKDFEDMPVGTYRVWGLAYTGEILAELGDDAGVVDLTDDCWSLSLNFVVVNCTDQQAPRDGEGAAGLAIIRSLQLAPNPAREQVALSFELGETAEPLSLLQVLDSRGVPVETLRVPSVPGQNTYELPTANWMGGLYVVYLNNGGEILTRKLIVLKE